MPKETEKEDPSGVDHDTGAEQDAERRMLLDEQRKQGSSGEDLNSGANKEHDPEALEKAEERMLMREPGGSSN